LRGIYAKKKVKREGNYETFEPVIIWKATLGGYHTSITRINMQRLLTKGRGHGEAS